MGKIICALLGIEFLVQFSPLGSASAIERKGPIAGVAAPRPTKMAPLTEGECTQLGGKVSSQAGAKVCTSGRYCVTKDENQEYHYVCISKQ